MSPFSLVSRRTFFASSAALAAALAFAIPSWLPSNSASAAPASPAPHADPRCVFGVSKDSCKGEIAGGLPKFLNCTRDGIECRTAIVQDSIFKFELRQAPGLCADPTFPELARCDETERLDGTVVVRGDLVLRMNHPCRFRGCWGGEFVLETEEGTVGSGRANGTLGTGTHRLPTCTDEAECGRECEGCYEVQFTPDPNQLEGTWRVHLEGMLDGAITSGAFASSEICVAVKGELTTRGTINGPYDVTEWKFCGTADGVVTSKCE